LRQPGAEPLPDRNDEYALLQLLLGTWPVALLDEGPVERQAIEDYAARIKGAMTKALREAKVHSTWASPQAAYEEAMLTLIDRALTGAAAQDFIAAFRPFARKIAALGASNSIIQTVLKLTLPGVPDVYQGTELWDLSMVDPDNRRPVDFAARQRMLEIVSAELAENRATAMESFARRWQDGCVKLAVIKTLLDLRQTQPTVFAEGAYQPLETSGPGVDTICAFTRQAGDVKLLVAVARFPARRARFGFDAGAGLTLRQTFDKGAIDVLTGRKFAEDFVPAERLFDSLPAVVLTNP
jgi:(1->4)-alpha-D-glucan 1-alpha-D-glucosylmutase